MMYYSLTVNVSHLLFRAHLWSSSPQRPNIAFTFDLLDWTEALLLECQVALKDLCKALLF